MLAHSGTRVMIVSWVAQLPHHAHLLPGFDTVFIVLRYYDTVMQIVDLFHPTSPARAVAVL
jgi:hypothetical protein